MQSDPGNELLEDVCNENKKGPEAYGGEVAPVQPRIARVHCKFVIQILTVRSTMLKISLSTATDIPILMGSPMVIAERRAV